MNYWIVRGSPAENGDFEFMASGVEHEWRTKRPPRNWEVGDRLLFWASSPRLQLISVGEFLGDTGDLTDDGQVIYGVRYLSQVVDRPLRLVELRADVQLKDAIFLKNGPASSVVRLSEAEGEHLYRLLLSENSSLKGVWPDLEEAAADLEDVDEFALEGDRRLAKHFRIERNRALVNAKKQTVVAATGHLRCEVCGFEFKDQYGILGEGFCEVHHKLPLAKIASPSLTRLEDLAVVCSNCHRMLHRSSGELSITALQQKLLRD